MVNRKISHVPLSASGRIDHMARVLRTRSNQALLAPGKGKDRPPGDSSVLGRSLSPTRPGLPPASTTAGYSPATSPIKNPNIYPTGIVTPSISTIFSSSTSALDPPTNSQSSSVCSLNPHINPFIFETSRSSQSMMSSNTSTAPLTMPGRSPLKRPASHFDPPPFRDHGNGPDEDQLPVDLFDDVPSGPVAPPQPSSQKLPPSLLYLPDEDRTFHVYFNIWQEQVPQTDHGKKPRRPPGGTRPSLRKLATTKFANYAPKLPTKLTVAPKFYSFASFKRALFTSCDKKLAGVSEALHQAWFDRRLSIQVFVNGSPLHKSNNKNTISNPHNFQEFIYAALTSPANTTMGCRILHEDPRKADLAIRCLKVVGKPGGDGSDSDDTDGHETDRSSVILSAGEKKLRILMKRFEKAFKSGENVTSVTNPKDPSQILLLNTSRIRDWANDWADGVRGVDKLNPPMSRSGFRWIKAGDYEKPRMNSWGGPPYAHLPAPGIAPPNPSPALSVGDLIPLAPPPGEAPSFEAFLVFAGITPDMRKTREALANEGISEFNRLLDRATYTLANFRSMGISFAHAEDLFKAVPKFLVHVQSSNLA
ncbi:hypothetical protein DFH28DRAFT_1131110 [Melampsora americana]|nr:hypothetical protein DFH28DRAFT_1131110 [Melampsora americana]